MSKEEIALQLTVEALKISVCCVLPKATRDEVRSHGVENHAKDLALFYNTVLESIKDADKK